MANGFAPNWYFGQQNAGLGIYIAPGDIRGNHFNGGFFPVPPNSTTVFWVTADGKIQSGNSAPDGEYVICQVVSGEVVTSSVAQFSQGSYPIYYNTDPGILSIQDLRI